MAMSYEVWAYKDGKPWKMTKVSAENKDEAIHKGWVKFAELGLDLQKIQRVTAS